MGTVLVIGSSNTDLVCRTTRIPRVGETVRGSSFATFPGGKGANVAVAAARSGGSVSFVGAVGNDAFGQQRLDELRAEGIDIRHVRVVEGIASGVALITVDDAGGNCIVIVPGANDAVRPDDARTAIAERRHGVMSINLEIPFESVETAVAANLGRTPTVLNAAPFDPRVSDILNAVDVLIVNEIEAGEVLGHEVTIESAARDARHIAASGPRAVAITLGAAGAVLATETHVVRIPAPHVPVVDTTGAGDAFCGALSAWLAGGATLVEAARAGVAAGSLAVGTAGAQPSLPHRAAIVALLERMAPV